MELTDEQLSTLRHMLGINDPSRADQLPWRNYAAVNPGDAKFIEMERLGLVRKDAERGSYWWYATTEEGQAVAIKSAIERRLPKSKRIYSAFLNIADAFPDLTFKEFLTNPYFADARKRA